MSDQPKRPLEYDRTTTVVSVRGFRVLILLTSINTIMLLWFAVAGQQGPQFVQRKWQEWKLKREARVEEAAMLAEQEKCLAHALPPGTIVYTEDLARGEALGKGGGYRAIRPINPTVPEWRAPLWLAPPAHWTALAGGRRVNPGIDVAGEAALVFLHERTTPLGERRLVAVELQAEQRFARGGSDPDTVEPRRQLLARAYVPMAAGASAKTAAHVQVELKLPNPDATFVPHAPDGSYAVQRGPALTVFAGQADPADRSHFTIAYEIDGKPGVIDGWVRDHEILLIKPRTGLHRFDRDRQAWELGVSPATAPATAPSAAP